ARNGHCQSTQIGRQPLSPRDSPVARCQIGRPSSDSLVESANLTAKAPGLKIRAIRTGFASLINHCLARTYRAPLSSSCDGHGVCLLPPLSYVADIDSQDRAGLLHLPLPPANLSNH